MFTLVEFTQVTLVRLAIAYAALYQHYATCQSLSDQPRGMQAVGSNRLISV
ncbi:MAG: hypothetical protein WBD47_22010 [Phormidesmis sp.]